MSEDGTRRGALLTSLAIHVLLLGIFPFLVARWGGPGEPEPVEIVFYEAAPRPIEAPPEPEPESRPKPVPPAEPAAEPEPEPVARPEPPPRPAPRPKPVVTARREPAPEPPPRPVAPQPPVPREPAKPKRVVRTAVFGDQPEPAARPAVARRETRTGSFGAAVAEQAPARPATTHRAAARPGVFEVSPTAGVATEQEDRPREVARAGFAGAPEGDAAPAPEPRERPAVASTGFDAGADDSTDTGTPQGRPSGAPVRTGGFGDVVVAEAPPARSERAAARPETPVQIVSKPAPSYTEEARALRVEGEVVLEVVFEASGRTRVIGVVEGLGHGLDETAIEAARGIEFEPARREGRAVDYNAVLRIVFQLA